MANFKIYHNPRCSKSRQALKIIRDNGIEPKIVEYLKVQLGKNELEIICKSLGKRPKEFVRKNEIDFKDNGINELIEDDLALISAMLKFPKIIERPIVLSGGEAVIGRPPENVLKLIN